MGLETPTKIVATTTAIGGVGTTEEIGTTTTTGMEGVVTATIRLINQLSTKGVIPHLRGFWGPTHQLLAKYAIFLGTMLMFVLTATKIVLPTLTRPLPHFLPVKPVTTSGFLTRQPRLI